LGLLKAKQYVIADLKWDFWFRPPGGQFNDSSQVTLNWLALKLATGNKSANKAMRNGKVHYLLCPRPHPVFACSDTQLKK